ncbi:MAG: hypothetical protein K2K86_07580 [Muribaculaceae bacterium]|nr:hypothetical protein [Muribaculaceae bacterium]
MEYTLNELIAEWKMRKGLVPLRVDAAVTRHDAFEIDEYAARVIREWYEELLDTADVSLLDVEDITERVDIEDFSDGVAVMRLPDGCRRLVEVTMEQWRCPATIVGDLDSELALRQRSVFGRGGACCPVAVTEGAGRVRLYSFRGAVTPSPVRVLGVMSQPEGVIRCSPRALSLLFNS